MLTLTWELFLDGLREIWAHKFRSLLTMTGIILAVASVVSVMALIEGSKAAMREGMVELGGVERIGVHNDDPPEEQSSIRDRSPGLTMADVHIIENNIEGIAAMDPELHIGSHRIHYGGQRPPRQQVIGVSPPHFPVTNLLLAEGRLLNNLDLHLESRVVVLGSAARDNVFGIPEDEPGLNVVGEWILIRNQPFKVVGVLEQSEHPNFRQAREKGEIDRLGRYTDGRRGTMRNHFQWRNNRIYLPITTTASIFRSEFQDADEVDRSLTFLGVQVEDPADLERISEQMETLLFISHRGIRDFRVDTRLDWAERIERNIRNLAIQGFMIAGISLVVGGIGITNIMMASISERIREIGIRKSIGATGRAIFSMILVESTLICLIGGLLGLAGAFGLIDLIANLTEEEADPIVTTWSLMVGLGFAVSVGIMAGLYPAVKASRLDPITALRYE
ncbi:MAG: ABC transporter permease [Opitutales bacterium]|nr:ABC transporter permease [Opitutales bacterium]MCH8540810.1 ABC transporter permease [Opitutales bacterium]